MKNVSVNYTLSLLVPLQRCLVNILTVQSYKMYVLFDAVLSSSTFSHLVPFCLTYDIQRSCVKDGVGLGWEIYQNAGKGSGGLWCVQIGVFQKLQY